ncbi:PulJ/GspJ family protein [Gilvimarinus polysaccharolyticus]|uniref:PulJ/GspJ family protein n=1 Tax=Gilvimarinus polysaccharolyticus TaxID=863921 RepID=UPI0006732629|nr:prepilin-type N-terminal cleavage/methylation domain-containing protein [Gilvimarinus polysaccharolyticus]
MRHSPVAKGFTLIELITVIVIVGILAVIGTQFIVSSAESYDTTQKRALLVNTGRQALERVSRELRVALPYSLVHLTSGTSECIKFMPIAGDGHYQTPIVAGVGEAKIDTSYYRTDANHARYISIAALNSTELTLSASSSLAALAVTMTPSAASGSGELALAGTHAWLRNSANQRFYLLDAPRAFCLLAGELRYFNNVGVDEQTVPPAGSSTLIAQNVVSEGTGFNVGLDTVTNRSLVTLSVRFSLRGESVALKQEVALRNVP